MKVLLLGATGLLGHNVLRQLVDAGHEVVALVRHAEGIRLPAGGWQTAVGSALDADTLRRAADGCQAVVNCVGATDMSLRHIDDFRPANRDLPARVVGTMEELGIATLVHTSTVNTIGHGSAAEPADEQAPMRPPFDRSLYALSKLEGEQVVLQAARRHPEWHAVVVCPGFMLGAWDVKPSSGRMLQAAYRRPLMAAPPGGKAFVAVADVATAIVHALDRGANGERYIVAGQSMSIADLYRLQAGTMGYRQRLLVLPRWLMAAAGAAGDALRACGLRTELSSNNLRQLAVQEHYDGSRAARELDITYTSIAEAIKQYHQWKEDTRR